MCFTALLNGDATERPLLELLRDELPWSVANGTVAALIVLAVLTTEGAPLGRTAPFTVGAVAFGTVLHQSVLAWGVLLLRGRSRLRRRSAARS